ncbi:hypothetical protein Q5O14_16370 [Eubacteriaceae bacterium ES2]|nr:hypothetical protein Q5O14_16370 [Eubacteriaceae bacterium ES2]
MSKKKSINAMISVETMRKEYLVHRKIKLMTMLEPDGVKVSNLGDDLDASCIHGNQSRAFEDILPELMVIQTEINECNKEIDFLTETKEKIFEKIKEMDNVKDQVKYLREYIGLSLYDVSEVLGYSYNYVKKLSSKK